MTTGQAEKAKQVASRVQEATKAAEDAKQRLYSTVGVAEAPADLSPRVKTLADRIIAKMDERANAAMARFKARHQGGVTLNTGLPADDLIDLTDWGAAKIVKGTAELSKWSAEMAKDFGEWVKPHLQQVWDAAHKNIDDAVTKGVGSKDREQVKAKVGGKTTPVDIAGHAPGTKMEPARVKALWDKAKTDYIDKGETNLTKIAHGLATDTGLPVNDVRRGLAQPKGAKAVTDEMYRKQSEQRRVVQQAKTWVRNAGNPAWMRAMKQTPGLFFSLKTLGHSTVGMVTHAGPTLASAVPGGARFRSYFKNFSEQYRMVGSKAHHEMVLQDLEQRPNYTTAQRAGLANNVSKMQDEYQSAAESLLGKLGLPAGARGFDALKVLRQDLFDQAWDKLPASLKTPEMAKNIATDANHLTGYGKNILGQGALGDAASVLLFAPKLEGSRWGFLVGDPRRAAKIAANWKGETPENQAWAMSQVKQKATMAAVYMGYLAANQGILSATGSNQKINFDDPSKADWLSFKVAGHNVGIIGPMLGSIRFLTDLIKYPTESSKELQPLRTTRLGRVRRAGLPAAAHAVGESPCACLPAPRGHRPDHMGRVRGEDVRAPPG